MIEMYFSLKDFVGEVDNIVDVKDLYDEYYARINKDDIWHLLDKWWPNITVVQYKLKIKSVFSEQFQCYYLHEVYAVFEREGLIFDSK